MTRQADRITDKMRLDWLGVTKTGILRSSISPGYWVVCPSAPAIANKELRKAIDAAIRAEKRGGAK